jgi:hypothetical protein
MKYMLLIFTPPDVYATLAPGVAAGISDEYISYTKKIMDSGEFVAGDPLQGIETATTVRSRGGQRTLTDGPYAETKEVLGGYYVVDVKDLDRALELASQLPGVRHEFDIIEVRPIQDFLPT